MYNERRVKRKIHEFYTSESVPPSHQHYATLQRRKQLNCLCDSLMILTSHFLSRQWTWQTTPQGSANQYNKANWNCQYRLCKNLTASKVKRGSSKCMPQVEFLNSKGSTSLGNRQEIVGLGWWEGQHGLKPGRNDRKRACGQESVEFSLELPSLTLTANPGLTHSPPQPG